MVIHKKLLNIAVIALMFVSCQQEADDFSALSGALGNAAVENRTAERLFRLMEQQDGSYKRLQKSLGTGTPDFAHTETGATADYGTFYLIPYTDAEGVISGAIIYPTDEQNTDLETRSLDGMLGTPVNVTPEYLNTDIPTTSRLLYSNRFLVWSDNGMAVSPQLYQFALKLSEGDVPITEEERRAADERVLLPATRMAYIPGYVYVNATFDLYSYDWVKEDLDASAVALSKQTLESIIQDAFRQYTSRLHAALVETVFPTYHALTLALKVTDDAFYESGTFGDVLRDVFEEVRYQVYWKGFNITFNYWFDIAPRESTGTTSGGGGSGSQTGGTTGSAGAGGNSDVSEGPDVSEFVTDCSHTDSVRKRAVQAIYDSLKITDKYLINKEKNISYSDFQKAAAANDVECSTALNKYTFEVDDGTLGTLHSLSELKKGDKLNVENSVGMYTVAAIHSHPNNTAPSFKDVLFTAQEVVEPEFTQYKATIIYTPIDSSNYVLYVHDSEKAKAFFETIKSEVSESTHDLISGGKMELALQGKRLHPSHENLMYRIAAVFEIYDTGMSLLGIDNKGQVTSYSAGRAYKKNGKEKKSLIFKKCP